MLRRVLWRRVLCAFCCLHCAISIIVLRLVLWRRARDSVTLLYAGGQLLGQLHLDPHEQLAPPPRPALDNFTIQISITLWTTKSLVTLSLNPVLACQDGE